MTRPGSRSSSARGYQLAREASRLGIRPTQAPKTIAADNRKARPRLIRLGAAVKICTYALQPPHRFLLEEFGVEAAALLSLLIVGAGGLVYRPLAASGR
jgi:hypothetical protein